MRSPGANEENAEKSEHPTGEAPDLLVERTGQATWITLHRPAARNALTLGVLARARDALRGAGTDSSVRCVVIAGAGGHFCAGADLRQSFQDDPQLMDHLESYMDAFHGLIEAVVRCPKPVVASLEGAAVGFGADLAFACDLRVAATTAYVQEKFVGLGLMPDGGGTFWLPRLVGTARAMQMILLAERVDAAELLRLGVVTKVVQADALREATFEVVRSLEAGPPLAFAAIKRSLYASWGSFEDALRREREEQLRLLVSRDVQEGVAAWAEKRAPSFIGR
ncbi:MAG TPA: enoyl-CoA hydratase-related protein [Polyangiaceae bacterium]|jgi:2-(1,2-epoxy-1,2-dihydrophenyl)acetyl-CoA isomerase|nr:enoyl-CoA hydratase-related protein [Polyangiaceae bacterium]